MRSVGLIGIVRTDSIPTRLATIEDEFEPLEASIRKTARERDSAIQLAVGIAQGKLRRQARRARLPGRFRVLQSTGGGTSLTSGVNSSTSSMVAAVIDTNRPASSPASRRQP
jgi:hypothetical protein